MQSAKNLLQLCGLSTDPKYVSLNHHEIPFYVQICFSASATRFLSLTLADNYVKMNQNTPSLPYHQQQQNVCSKL